jgi:hypothetical protein
MTASFSLRRVQALDAFYFLLGAALLAHVAQDLWAGIWELHAGRLFPWRHPGVVPLYPAPWLLLEWSVAVLAGLGLWLERWRWPAACLGAAVFFVSCTQRFSNQKALLLICLVYLALAGQRHLPAALRLLRWQIAIVYAFSALAQWRAGFLDGTTLEALGLGFGISVPLSWAVVVAELLLPILLLRFSLLGFAGVLLLHLTFAFLMHGLWPFTLAMIALATLYLGEETPIPRLRFRRRHPASTAPSNS